MDIEKLYEKHRHIITAMSGQVSRITGIEQEELECQGNLIFCECFHAYDPARGEFIPFLTTSLYFELFKYARKLSSSFTETDGGDFDIPDQSQNPEWFTIQKITLENLSKDARQVTDLLLNSENFLPGENDLFAERGKRDAHEVRVKKKHLKEHFKEFGWSRFRIERAFDEIAMLVQ